MLLASAVEEIERLLAELTPIDDWQPCQLSPGALRALLREREVMAAALEPFAAVADEIPGR